MNNKVRFAGHEYELRNGQIFKDSEPMPVIISGPKIESIREIGALLVGDVVFYNGNFYQRI